jgi:hypothetical protein
MKIDLLKMTILFTFLFLATFNSIHSQSNIEIKSPNEKIKVEFSLLLSSQPFYKVVYDSIIIIDNSALGFVFKDQPIMLDNFKVTNTNRKYFLGKWETIWGTQDSILDEYNELIISLEEKDDLARKMNIIFKVYDDGIGFRYEFPDQLNMNDIVIMDELTEFRLTGDHSCWWIPGDYDSYEYLYNNSKLSEIDLTPFNYETRGDRNLPNKRAVNTPITMETSEGLFLSFHEANLTDYAGLTLEANDDLTLKVDLVPWSDGTKVKTKVPFKTPWRTIQISNSAQDLISSNLILNLNEPNKLDDITWIEPMKYIGIWWEMHLGKSSWSMNPIDGSWANNSKNHGATTLNAKYYIDFAAKNNIKGVLIEGWNTGWEYWGADTLDYFDFVTPYADFDIQEVVKYANENGVEIIGHHETGGQAENYEKHLENAFAFYNELGIRAVKTGYAGQIIPKGEYHHGQYMVRHYRKVLETAAKYRIMLDAHEPIAATGLRRTYPNMMTREGVRGMEYNAWSDGNPPEHTTIIPFTRMLSGPIDYTPGIFDLTFDEYKDKERVQTTLAKQLAYYVIIYSPMQMAADLPENYLNNPAFEFIRKVPVNWSKSRYLNSKIGDFVTIARKNGDNWYLGSITDEFARSISVSLSFLDEDKIYKATIYKDGSKADWKNNPYDFEISEDFVDSTMRLRLKLAKGGGQAIIFEPYKDR